MIGAVASAVDMRLSFQGGASVMRLYEGTDTRSQDILVGAALAIGMAMWAQRRTSLPPAQANGVERPGWCGPTPPRGRPEPSLRRPTDGTSVVAAASGSSPSPPGRSPRTGADSRSRCVGWAAVAAGVYLGPAGDRSRTLPVRGRLLPVRPRGGRGHLLRGHHPGRLAVTLALGNPVFRYVGKISYGTYLWHSRSSPCSSAQRLHLIGYPLLAVRIGVTLVVATGSFYLVEEPIRRGRIRTFTEWRAWLVTVGCLRGCGGGHRGGHPAVGRRGRRPASGSRGRPVQSVPRSRSLVFGDSVAWRLGFAMLASQPQTTYDVSIDNGAIIGCGVLQSSQYLLYGLAHPDVPAVRSRRHRSPASGRRSGRATSSQFQPNVVVVLAGRWEVSDRLIGGHWLHIGQPAFDAALEAVTGAGGAGGHVDRGADGADDLPVLRPRRAGQRPALARGLRQAGWPPTTPLCARWRPSTRPPWNSTISGHCSAPAASTRSRSTGCRFGTVTACTSRRLRPPASGSMPGCYPR